MKRLNIDKVYKYIPKQEKKEESISNTQSIQINQIKHIKHGIDAKRQQQKNRLIYHKKHQQSRINPQNNFQQNSFIRCAKCNKPITEQLSSFHNDEKNEDYCFDCALNEAKILLSADSKNKIMYLGAGTFGEVKEIKSEKKFMIIKRVKFSKPKFEKFSMNYLPFDQY